MGLSDPILSASDVAESFTGGPSRLSHVVWLATRPAENPL